MAFIEQLFCQKEARRLTDQERATLRTLLSTPNNKGTELTELAIELAVACVAVIRLVEGDFRSKEVGQALAHKFVDSWVLVQGLEESAEKLINLKEDRVAAVFVENARRAAQEVILLLTTLGYGEYSLLLCNLLIELSKYPNSIHLSECVNSAHL